MLDMNVQRLVERTIDSPLKLQLLLHFAEHRREGTAGQIAQRIFRDIWSTHEALRELAEDGVLVARHGAAEVVYHYHPLAELTEAIRRLCQLYNEPLERDDLQRLVRDVAAYAPYKRAASGGFEHEYFVPAM